MTFNFYGVEPQTHHSADSGAITIPEDNNIMHREVHYL